MRAELIILLQVHKSLTNVHLVWAAPNSPPSSVCSLVSIPARSVLVQVWWREHLIPTPCQVLWPNLPVVWFTVSCWDLYEMCLILCYREIGMSSLISHTKYCCKRSAIIVWKPHIFHDYLMHEIHDGAVQDLITKRWNNWFQRWCMGVISELPFMWQNY